MKIPKNKDYGKYGIFDVTTDEGGNLVISVPDPDDLAELIAEIKHYLDDKGYSWVEQEVFEPMWTNDLDFTSDLDNWGHMTRAPGFSNVWQGDWDNIGDAIYYETKLNAVGWDYELYLKYLEEKAHEFQRKRDLINSIVWWYPDYCLRSPLDDLLETGKTVFTLGQ